jgi:hypothetical protein
VTTRQTVFAIQQVGLLLDVQGNHKSGACPAFSFSVYEKNLHTTSINKNQIIRNIFDDDLF